MGKLHYLPALGDLNTPLSEQQLAILEQQVEKEKPEPSIQSQFNFAWGLIKSSDKADNKQGINILTDIFKNVPSRRRECLYYLSMGCYKIGEFKESKRYVDALLVHEPENLQALQLKNEIDNEIAKDGLIGFAIISGLTAVGVGLAGAFIKHQSRKN
ncbi:hypothetical protein CANARDRAFT_29381 [[Candida] arabinofermentans NRRL YB-2248]|uniref:Mitochondrial fission 1 protein n=1 Tax=[Candida] arabinofermentans NRRL YB-2248 TaxID=983967 RepID=A0A1E4SXM0_9ASCO|nr:hypothetical protein CANARDRAFT_29381 [[Candida] arabinofermentans NRRL YB-2248]